MKIIKFIYRDKDILLTLAIAIFGLAASNFLIFHIAVEGITMIIGIIFFVEAHKTKDNNNSFMLFIGYALLFTAVIDFFHVLTYRDMGFPIKDSANKATQLWLAGRYMLSCSLLLAPAWLKRHCSETYFRLVFGLVTAMVLAIIFFFDVIPVCLTDDGQTHFKIHNEYIIIMIFALALGYFYRKRALLYRNFYMGIQHAMAIFILSELCFSLYVNAFSDINMLGHIFKVLGYGFIYYILNEPNVRKAKQTVSKAE